MYALVEPVRPYKREDEKIEFVPLEKLAELSSYDVAELPSIIGMGAAAIGCASYSLEAVQDMSSKRTSSRITNFTMFDQTKLDALIEPFVPGMSRHITPIKYEALTPDLYCFLFRTLGKDGQYYHFVLIEYDFLADLKGAKDVVSKWHGEVLAFVPPHNAQVETEPSLSDLSYIYDKVYKGMLARVDPPTGAGYWAAHFVLMPGDDVDAALAHLPKEQQMGIKHRLAEIKDKGASVSVYVKPEGGYELFVAAV